MSCPPFSSSVRGGAGCCGKMPVHSKDEIYGKMKLPKGAAENQPGS